MNASVLRLEHVFEDISNSRMAGLPMTHPGLRVQAIGFAPYDDAALLGVLVTPWFMNLVLLPLDEPVERAGIGEMRMRRLGGLEFQFVGASIAGIGAYEAASLYSPMFEFADQHAAVATAVEVLKQLRPETAVAGPVAARRGFLFGRRTRVDA